MEYMPVKPYWVVDNEEEPEPTPRHDPAKNAGTEPKFMDPVPYFEDRVSRRSTRTPAAVRSVATGCGCGGGSCGCGPGKGTQHASQEFMDLPAPYHAPEKQAQVANAEPDFAERAELIQAACAELRAKKMA